jgi:TIR domain-containing protein
MPSTKTPNRPRASRRNFVGVISWPRQLVFIRSLHAEKLASASVVGKQSCSEATWCAKKPVTPRTMPDDFKYDLFLSHSSKDKAVVRSIAERLRADGRKVWFDEWEIRPGDNIPAKIEEGLEHSRVLVLCMSANAFGSDWAQLEAGTFRFRDPLNKERRFIPLRIDDAPIKGSLAQFHYINWLPEHQEQEYAKLFQACQPEDDARTSFAPGFESGKLGAAFASLIKQKDQLPFRTETIQIDALQLCAKLRSVPPLTEEDFKKDYKGFWVCWWTTLSSATKDSFDSDLCRLQLLPELSEGYTTPIECSVRLADYPILKVLQRGARLRVRGQIDDFSLFSVRLANATIEFPETASVNSNKSSKLVPVVHAIKPNQGQSHSFRICLENQGTATADLIQLTVRTSEVGLPYFSTGLWRMEPCHVPYSFKTNGSLNPKVHERIFEVGFQQDPDEFTFEFNISARDSLPQQCLIRFSREESRKLVRKEGALAYA